MATKSTERVYSVYRENDKSNEVLISLMAADDYDALMTASRLTGYPMSLLHIGKPVATSAA